MTTSKPKKQRERAVVCLSGGMDSCVTAALAARDYEAYALHFSYGQLTETREFNAARAVAQELGIREVMHLRIDLFRRIGGSALTDSHIAVPHTRRGRRTGRRSGRGHPRHLRPVPQRPLPIRRRKLGGGAGCKTGLYRRGRAGQFRLPRLPACLLRGLQPAYRSRHKRGRYPDHHAVAIAMKKVEIVRLGLELHAPFHVTWSCYSGDAAACGACDSCVLRLRAFRQAGIADPLPYETAR